MTPSPLAAEQSTSSVGQFRYCTVEAVDAVIAQIEQEIAERRAKIAELEQVRGDLNVPNIHELLKRIEWEGYHGGPPVCPECGAEAPNPGDNGHHRQHCELARALEWLSSKQVTPRQIECAPSTVVINDPWRQR